MDVEADNANSVRYMEHTHVAFDNLFQLPVGHTHGEIDRMFRSAWMWSPQQQG